MVSARHDDCARLLARAGFTDRSAAARCFGTEEKSVEIPIRHCAAPRRNTRETGEWIQCRPARKLNPLRAKVAAWAQTLFTPGDLGEENGALCELLSRTGEITRVRHGLPGTRPRLPRGDVRLRKFEPLFRRTEIFWRHWGLIQAKHHATRR